jgi:hypothetical protein
MSWIDPEKIMTGLMKSMGVSPADFVGFIQTAQREFAEMRADRLAFKPASIKAFTEVQQRLERIEAKQQCLFDLIVPVLRASITEPDAIEILERYDHERNNAGH